jgi:phosphinothricin acetyltransferase
LAVLVVQGYRNAYAGIALPNIASVRLHESIGFTPVGIYRGVGFKHGGWRDVAWFERLLAPRESAPTAPRLLPQCWETPAFMAAIKVGEESLAG